MSEKPVYIPDVKNDKSEAERMLEPAAGGEQLVPFAQSEAGYQPLQGVNQEDIDRMRAEKSAREAEEIQQARQKLEDVSTRKQLAKGALKGVALAGALIGGTTVLVDGGKEIFHVVSDKIKANELKEQKKVPDSNKLEFDIPPKFVVNDKGATEVQVSLSVKDALGKTIDYDFDVSTLGLSVEQAGQTNIEVADLKTSSPDMTGKVIRFRGGVDGSRQVEVTITTINGKQGGFKVFKRVSIMDSEGKPLTTPQQTEVKGTEDFSMG